jgi:hypothetical protein
VTEGFEVYAELVTSLLQAERSRKTALEQKATNVITTSGTMVTLLFGLVAVITAKQSFSLPVASHGWLVAAVVLFVIATGLALFISIPRPYGETKLTVENLRAWWHDPVADAQAAAATVRLEAVETARLANATKAQMLIAAIGAELVAIALLAVSIVVILHTAK